MADAGEFGEGDEDRDSDGVWRLDLIAPTKEPAKAVVGKLGLEVKDRKLFLHPGRGCRTQRLQSIFDGP